MPGKSMARQMFELGLITEEQYREQACDTRPDVAISSSETRRKNLVRRDELQILNPDGLDKCSSMSEFKRVARAILLNDPTQIHIVIQKAHRFKCEAYAANRKFIWLWYHIRDQLADLPTDQHKTFLRKALRKSGAKYNPPPT